MSDTDPFRIKDPTVLTYVEHQLLGSSMPEREDMKANRFKPQAVLDGRRAIEVAADRISQREIVGMDGESFRLPKNHVPVIALNVISTRTGEVVDRTVRLTGIMDYHTEEIERDPEVLKQYGLTEEGRKKYGIEIEVGRREKVG